MRSFCTQLLLERLHPRASIRPHTLSTIIFPRLEFSIALQFPTDDFSADLPSADPDPLPYAGFASE
jgi:hypothetical protein